jgi:hypothetical protein
MTAPAFAPTRALLLGLVLVALGAGCTRPREEQPAPAAQAALEVDDCTGDTALVPGIPGSPGHLIPTELQPSGASELAVLMRTMQADLAKSAERLRAGSPPPEALYPTHRRIRCAWPTDPGERTASYDAFAVAYLEQVRALDARPDELRAAHDRIVDGCVACHQTTCTGPLPAIEKLRVEP